MCLSVSLHSCGGQVRLWGAQQQILHQAFRHITGLHGGLDAYRPALPVSYSLALLICLSLSLLNPVPFREAPAYSNRRRRPPNTLAAPRVLLRSNSDNNLHAGAPEWAVCSAATSHRSLSPQLLQQTPSKPDGATKSLGSYVPGPRSRSPSLNRLGGTGEDGKRPQPHWHVG